MEASEAKEGKIELTAACDGLFRVDVERLNQINEIDQVMIATRPQQYSCKKGRQAGGNPGDSPDHQERKDGTGERAGRGNASL